MLFPTLTFGLFFLFVYVAAWSLERDQRVAQDLPAPRLLVFYGAWDWRFVALLIASARAQLGRGAADRRR